LSDTHNASLLFIVIIISHFFIFQVLFISRYFSLLLLKFPTSFIKQKGYQKCGNGLLKVF